MDGVEIERSKYLLVAVQTIELIDIQWMHAQESCACFAIPHPALSFRLSNRDNSRYLLRTCGKMVGRQLGTRKAASNSDGPGRLETPLPKRMFCFVDPYSETGTRKDGTKHRTDLVVTRNTVRRCQPSSHE